MNSEQGFAALFASLQTAQDESLIRHSQAVQRGDPEALRAEADLQCKLLDARQQLQRLRDTWQPLLGEQPGTIEPEKDRAPKVSVGAGRRKSRKGTPTRAFDVPILQALEYMGGRGATDAVVKRVGQIMADVLIEYDWATIKSGSIRWKKKANFARLHMKHEGLLKDNSPRGIWEISEQGRRYLQDHKK